MKTLNNNIEEKRVGFPNAKLLKEKGFEVHTCTYFEAFIQTSGGNLAYKFERENDNKENYNNFDYKFEESSIVFARPTQQVAIDWILINFGINIHVESDSYGECFYPKISSASKKTWDNLELRSLIIASLHNTNLFEFKNPEDAKEAAINHVLTNLN